MTERSNESLVAELRARTDARRHDGTYPPDIDDELRADFDQRLQAVSTHTTALRAAVAQVRALGPFEVRSYRGTSRVKSLYDRLVHRVIGHALADIVRQMDAYRTAVDRVLEAVVEEAEDRTIDDAPG